MNTYDKLNLLFAAAEFDVCAAPGSSVHLTTNSTLPGVYPTRLPDGSVCNLFKVLLTNKCEFNCLYCGNRKNRNIPRTELLPDELAKTFIQYYYRKHVHGLFLTSAIYGTSSLTMDKLLICCEILRTKYKFMGYIHLKILPGITTGQMDQALRLASRVSINLEAPTELHLKRLAPQKKFYPDLMAKLRYLSTRCKLPKFKLPNLHQYPDVSSGFTCPDRIIGIPDGSRRTALPSLTTQFIVGAANESDKDTVTRLAELKSVYNVARVYFSAFIPISETPLSSHRATPSLREHRLYQTDWLLTYYGFKTEEMAFDNQGNLPLDKDPKTVWAEQHPEFFPLEINRAEYYQLLRIPGIGPLTAEKICRYRSKNTKLRSFTELQRLGVKTKKIIPYVLVNGTDGKKNLANKICIPVQNHQYYQPELFTG